MPDGTDPVPYSVHGAVWAANCLAYVLQNWFWTAPVPASEGPQGAVNWTDSEIVDIQCLSALRRDPGRLAQRCDLMFMHDRQNRLFHQSSDEDAARELFRFEVVKGWMIRSALRILFAVDMPGWIYSGDAAQQPPPTALPDRIPSSILRPRGIDFAEDQIQHFYRMIANEQYFMAHRPDWTDPEFRAAARLFPTAPALPAKRAAPSEAAAAAAEEEDSGSPPKMARTEQHRPSYVPSWVLDPRAMPPPDDRQVFMFSGVGSAPPQPPPSQPSQPPPACVSPSPQGSTPASAAAAAQEPAQGSPSGSQTSVETATTTTQGSGETSAESQSASPAAAAAAAAADADAADAAGGGFATDVPEPDVTVWLVPDGPPWPEPAEFDFDSFYPDPGQRLENPTAGDGQKRPSAKKLRRLQQKLQQEKWFKERSERQDRMFQEREREYRAQRQAKWEETERKQAQEKEKETGEEVLARLQRKLGYSQQVVPDRQQQQHPQHPQQQQQRQQQQQQQQQQRPLPQAAQQLQHHQQQQNHQQQQHQQQQHQQQHQRPLLQDAQEMQQLRQQMQQLEQKLLEQSQQIKHDERQIHQLRQALGQQQQQPQRQGVHEQLHELQKQQDELVHQALDACQQSHIPQHQQPQQQPGQQWPVSHNQTGPAPPMKPQQQQPPLVPPPASLARTPLPSGPRTQHAPNAPKTSVPNMHGLPLASGQAQASSNTMERSFSDVASRFFGPPGERRPEAHMQASPSTDEQSCNDVPMQTSPIMEEQDFGHIHAKTFHNVQINKPDIMTLSDSDMLQRIGADGQYIADPMLGSLFDSSSAPRSYDQMVYMTNDPGSRASSSSNPPAPSTQPAQASTTASSFGLTMPFLSDVRSDDYQAPTNVDVQGIYFDEPDYSSQPMLIGDLADFLAMHASPPSADYGSSTFATQGESSQAGGSLGDPIPLQDEFGSGSSGTPDKAKSASSQPSQTDSLAVVDDDGDVRIPDAADDGGGQNTSSGGPPAKGPTNPFGGTKPKPIQRRGRGRPRKSKGVDRGPGAGAAEAAPGPSPLSQVETVSYSQPVVQPALPPQALRAPQAPQPQAVPAPQAVQVPQAVQAPQAPQAPQPRAAQTSQAAQAASIPPRAAPLAPQAVQAPQGAQAAQPPRAPPQAPSQAPQVPQPMTPAQSGQAQTLAMRGPGQAPSSYMSYLPIPEIQGMRRPPTPRTYEGFQAQIPPENDCFMGAPAMDEFNPDSPGYYQP